MAGQVERDGATGLCQHRLDEHPAVQIGAEAVDEENGDRIAAAEIEHPQPFAAGLDVSRRRSSLLRGRLARRLRGDKAGDKGVDLGIGDAGGRRHGKQRADRQCGPLLGDDAAQGAAFRRFEDIGDLARLDF